MSRELLFCAATFCIVFPSIAFNTDLVGRGFDASGQPFEKCLSTGSTFIFLGTSTVEMTSNQDVDSLSDSLSGSMDIKADLLFGLASGSAKLDFCKEASSKNLEYSEVFSLKTKVGHYAVFDNELSDAGRELMTQKQCGYQFLRSVALGGSFYVVTKLRFKERESYQRFVKQVTVEALWGLVKKTYNSKDEHRDKSGEFDLEVKAFQSGGKPFELDKIMGYMESIRCEDPELCLLLRDRLLEYAKNQLPEQFSVPRVPEQLTEFLSTLEIQQASFEKYHP